MQYARTNQLDYGTDDDATVIDHAPHWSIRQAMPPLPPPRPVARPAVRAPLPAPARAQGVFYSHVEASAQQHLDTERVPALSMSEVMSPTWARLDRGWQRFAGPICGLVAGLILVVGYLAYSSAPGKASFAGAAHAPAPTTELAIREVPATSDDDLDDRTPEARTPEASPPEAAVAPPAPVAKRAPTITTVNRSAPSRRVSANKSSKRRPIRVDASSALGNLRPGHSF